MKDYAKAILYIYHGIDGVVSQIDDLVLRRALASFSDSTSCEKQAERIIGYIEQKKLLLALRCKTEAALSEFTEEEVKYFEYKYFKRKPADYFVGFDAAGRNYFRKQIRLLEKFCFALARQGIDEESFRRDYLQMEFIRDLVRRIRRSEEKAAELGRARAAAAKREEKKVQRYSLSL